MSLFRSLTLRLRLAEQRTPEENSSPLKNTIRRTGITVCQLCCVVKVGLRFRRRVYVIVNLSLFVLLTVSFGF